MFKLALLGAPQLFLNGQRILQQITGKHLALLVYLAISEQPHRRDSLAALLWCDLPNSQARKQLSNVLSDLRKQLGDYLLIDAQEVCFNQTLTHWVDVSAFRHYITTEQVRNDSALLQETLALYRGEFLTGFSVRGAPFFEEWVLQQRAELHTLAIQGLLLQTEHALAYGHYAIGIAASERCLLLEPENETAHCQKMRLLAANGQRSAALAQYARCCQILEEEFGVAPAQETSALYAQIKADDYHARKKELTTPESTVGRVTAGLADLSSALPVPTLPHNLPIHLSPFLGRQEELTNIKKTLLHSTCRLLTITGMGGVGKTRLAQEAARQLLTQPEGIALFSDGIYFVTLDETTPTAAVPTVDAEHFLYSYLSTTLGLPCVTGQALPTQVVAHLQPKQMLLVIDNLEHRLDQLPALVSLLQAAPQLIVIATSRIRLNLPGEWLLPLTGLPLADLEQEQGEFLPRQPQTDRATADDATALFLALANQLDRHFTVTPHIQAEIQRICRLVEGLPLGIELAASWLSLFDCHTIAETLAHDLTTLVFSRHGLPARHASLSENLRYSWELLSNDERNTLRQLAQFKAPFLLEEAKAQKITLPHLRVLADQSLLRTTYDNRYEIHGLMRRYIHEEQS